MRRELRGTVRRLGEDLARIAPPWRLGCEGRAACRRCRTSVVLPSATLDGALMRSATYAEPVITRKQERARGRARCCHVATQETEAPRGARCGEEEPHDRVARWTLNL
jgi:hypothetical protein